MNNVKNVNNYTMRLCNGIKIEGGPMRSALYHINKGIAYPVSNDELAIIHALNFDHDSVVGYSAIRKKAKLEKDKFNNAIRGLKNKKVITKGKPKKINLSIVPLTLPNAPVRINKAWIELSLKCNQKCIHCYNHSSSKHNIEISLSYWKKIIKEIILFGCDTLIFIGGEPLLHQDELTTLIEYAKSIRHDQSIVIFSNLSIELSVNLKKIINDPDIHISTSLHGITHEDHDKFVNCRGSFNKTLNNISIITKSGKSVFVCASIKKDKKEEIEYINFFKKEKIKNYSFSKITKIGRATELITYETGQNCILPSYQRFTANTVYVGDSKHTCFYNHISVDPQGFVMPCIMNRVKTINLCEKNLPDYFASKEFNFFSNLGKSKVAACNICEFKYSCYDCRIKSWANFGNWLQKPGCGYDPFAKIENY